MQEDKLCNRVKGERGRTRKDVGHMQLRCCFHTVLLERGAEFAVPIALVRATPVPAHLLKV